MGDFTCIYFLPRKYLPDLYSSLHELEYQLQLDQYDDHFSQVDIVFSMDEEVVAIVNFAEYEVGHLSGYLIAHEPTLYDKLNLQIAYRIMHILRKADSN